MCTSETTQYFHNTETMGAVHQALSRRPLSSGTHSNTMLLFKWYHQGSAERLFFVQSYFEGENKTNAWQSNGFQRCPLSSSAHSNAIEPFPKISPTSGTLVCLWYHRGGTKRLNFRPSYFKGRIRKKTRQSNWLSGRLQSFSAHSDAIDPFPTLSPMPDTLVCLWYHWGGRGKT